MRPSKIIFLGILLISFTIAVRVDADANFVLSDLQVPDKVINRFAFLDEEVPISVTVTNTGDSSGSYTVTLRIDGNASGTSRVVLSAGESTEVEFAPELFGDPMKAMWPGNNDMTGAVYQIEVDGLSSTVSVTPFPDFTVYFVIIDIICIAGIILFIRWVSSPD